LIAEHDSSRNMNEKLYVVFCRNFLKQKKEAWFDQGRSFRSTIIYYSKSWSWYRPGKKWWQRGPCGVGENCRSQSTWVFKTMTSRNGKVVPAFWPKCCKRVDLAQESESWAAASWVIKCPHWTSPNH
jgi:hypothetical protein